MSFHVLERKASQEESRFFIETDSEYESGAEDHVDHLKLILQKADALAAENSIKEAFECFSVAVGYGSFRPERLSTLVDCILRNFKETEPDVPSQTKRTANMFECPCCQHFLGFAVTLTCGHSYCKRCIQSSQLYKCKLCREPVRTQPDDHKVNVVLCGLLEKCFPDEQKTFKTHWEIDELSRSKRFEEAVSLATDIIEADPGTAGVVRLSRAEAYAGLHQYQMALEDVELCLTSSHSAQYFFRNAVLLRKMGKVDQALRVFLHCLALDEDFPAAKQQVEMILWDLLSPAGEDVKEGLRETAQSASPHPHSENLIAHAQAQQSPAQHQHQPPAASTHDHHNQEIPGRWGRLEQPGLSRGHSLQAHASALDGEVLKRVCSAPQLGGQEKGSLLKRKLSVSDPGPCVVYSAGGKQKKQGASVASCQPCTSLPQHLLDPSDLECSLCMRLFYEPVTTPCGHTFCKICLERCLDHAPHCPLCKESLKDYLETRRYTVTSVLDTLIKQYLREQHEERANMFLEETRELSDLTRSVPIFVCTMAYPTVPCPLHVFEPRYRLMVRRCMDTGTQQFGMCIHDQQKGFADHGCMLRIRSVHFLPDGRSVVDTVGGKRFRVLSRGMRDGYSIADIEHLEDTRVEDGVDRLKLQELHDTVYEQARAWFQNLKVRFHNQILQHFGPMPEREADIQATPDGPACCWWLLAVLPIDPRYQLSVLSMTTLRERLVRIQHILGYLQSVPGN